jgi:hypothetical protein
MLLREQHPGSIRWAQCHRHLAPLDDNRTCDAAQRRGAIRAGGALWPGLVVCGVCGQRMTVRSRPDGRRPISVGAQVHKELAGTTCQVMRGDGIDAAMAQLRFAAMAPAPLTSALEAVEHLEAQARAIDHQGHLRLERARYEADRARRRYQAVEPENR